MRLAGILGKLASSPISVPAHIVENSLLGPHWGGFWPDEPTPEFDDVYIELAALKGEAGRYHSAACVARKEGPFDVCMDNGRTLQRYDDRWRAVGRLNRDRAAAFVLQAGIVVARRESADVSIGDQIAVPTIAAPSPAIALAVCGKDGET